MKLKYKQSGKHNTHTNRNRKKEKRQNTLCLRNRQQGLGSSFAGWGLSKEAFYFGV